MDDSVGCRLPAGAGDRLARQVAGHAERGAAAWAGVPGFAPGAAGAGFGARGARIAAAVERLRDRGRINAGRLAEYPEGVRRQLDQLAVVDAGAASRLAGGAGEP